MGGLIYFCSMLLLGKIINSLIKRAQNRPKKPLPPPPLPPPKKEIPVLDGFVSWEVLTGKDIERKEKNKIKLYQAQAEIERLQAELTDCAVLNDLITERYYQAESDKNRSETPATIAKFEKVLKQKIASDNKVRSLERKIERLQDDINRLKGDV